MDTTTEPEPGQLNVSQSIAVQNSPFAYALGSFGLESLFKVFAGFHVFYALVIFFLFEAATTVMSITYSALFPELFQGLRERARASSTYQSLDMFGELVGFSIPPFVYARFGFVPMAISFAVISGIALFLGIIGNKEDPDALQTPPWDLKRAFGEILVDRPFLLYTIAVTFLTYITGILTLGTPFWVKYTVGASPQSTSLIFAVVFGTAILSASVWGGFVHILGIRACWMLSVGLMASSAIIIGIAPNLLVERLVPRSLEQAWVGLKSVIKLSWPTLWIET